MKRCENNCKKDVVVADKCKVSRRQNSKFPLHGGRLIGVKLKNVETLYIGRPKGGLNEGCIYGIILIIASGPFHKVASKRLGCSCIVKPMHTASPIYSSRITVASQVVSLTVHFSFQLIEIRNTLSWCVLIRF